MSCCYGFSHIHLVLLRITSYDVGYLLEDYLLEDNLASSHPRTQESEIAADGRSRFSIASGLVEDGGVNAICVCILVKDLDLG